MPETKRQKIVTVISDAVKNISTANGYETDTGANVDDWRTDWQEDELPGTSICDLTEEVIENQTNEFVDFYTLPIQIRTFLSSATRAVAARKILADILQALRPLKDGYAVGSGAERQVLANKIELKRAGFVLADDGFKIVGIAVEIEVLYYTERFNAYQ